jgi:hypothetical protein
MGNYNTAILLYEADNFIAVQLIYTIFIANNFDYLINLATKNV